jgi:ribosomal protein S18 acetylase RimI-like enzyme
MPEGNHLVHIRKYRDRDLSKLYEIDKVCFAPHIAFSKAEILCQLRDRASITRIAEIDGAVVGFVLGRVDAPLFGHVLTLDVLPAARRARIGTSLMDALHAEFRKHHVLWTVLEVSASDSGARQFYERLDYRYIETLPDYYGGREDAFRMVRTLGKGDLL